MEFLSFLRMIGSLLVVLGLLGCALWAVRRFELRLPQNWLPGFSAPGKVRRLELVERLTLDPRRSVALIRKDGHEHLVLLTPEGSLVLEALREAPEVDPSTEVADAPEREKLAVPSFAAVFAQVREKAFGKAKPSDANA